MAEYHVGCGVTAIFAGTLNKKGDMWVQKSDVTDEAFSAVALYCLEHKTAMNFDYKEKRYRLAVTEIEAEFENKACKDCRYNDGEVHAECVICDKPEREVSNGDNN